ncbi:unnamed protein product [Vitrella brassicaformis CCMP3155]|uniref:Uncharacterized protein n=1 Tax=Vitrella brassicaformis (strain CCMP3155) TaxID=1169540 RepID=A0A0G4GXD9_VITBC|nr:unnamed protein product [Vitrella brassicaformis CCMP3155]|eukprot:CEM35646.1 unnamed protein product [Vitrella brassicaformis CCMP3155]
MQMGLAFSSWFSCGVTDCVRTDHCKGDVDELQWFVRDHLPSPSGAVFADTIPSSTDPLDRELLLFSLTANTAAFRWLLDMGANPNVCDSKGSSCLHAAARSGGLGVVRELVLKGGRVG